MSKSGIERRGGYRRAPVPAADDPHTWLGWYARMPGKVPAFEYLDLLFNPARISRSATGLTLRPLQAAPVELHPAGGRLYVAADRIDASHVLIVGRDGPEWSNGFSTYRKVSFWTLMAYWANLALGLAGLLHVLMAGSLRLIRGASVFHADPLAPVWLVIVAIPFAFALVAFGWQRLGDITPASLALAATTAALPLAATFGLWRTLRGPTRRRSAARRRDLWSLLAILQWCVVLTIWGMLPLRTWA